MMRRGPYDSMPTSALMQIKYRDDLVKQHAPFRHAKHGDCGYDLAFAADPKWRRSRVEQSESESANWYPEASICLFPGTFKLIPTGVFLKIPDGYFGLMCGRSSTFGKRGLFAVEARIDSGYVGELFIKLWHPAVAGGDFETPVQPAIIRPWDRVGQIVILPYLSPSIREVDDLPQTERGSTGFGSSGGIGS